MDTQSLNHTISLTRNWVRTKQQPLQEDVRFSAEIARRVAGLQTYPHFFRQTAPWKDAFSPTQEETREEATKQLETLEYFWVYHLKDGSDVGLWDGNKDFRFKDPSNYLELRHKAPPAVLFREDQDYAYTKECVLKASNKRAEEGRERIDLAGFQTSIYENSAAAPFRPTLRYLGQCYSNLDGFFCNILAFFVRRSVHSSDWCIRTELKASAPNHLAVVLAK